MAPVPPPENVLRMDNVRIIFRNFQGKEGQYNREGDRNFAVPIDDDLAKVLEKDGWNIKTLRPREDDEEQHAQPILPVSVKYGKGRPPRIVMVTSRGRTDLGEDEIEVLDYADIENVDLIVRPYEWSVNGKSGIKAYLKTMFVTIREDELEMKYADIHDVPTRSGRVED